MRSGKVVIGLFTAMLISIILFFGTREYAWDGTLGITMEIVSQGKQETIRCWESSWGEYFLFLPGYADLSQARIRTNTRRAVTLEDVLLKDGMTCENLTTDVQYDVCFDKNRHHALTLLQSGCLPAVYIDTASGSMEYIHEEKGNAEGGAIRVYTATGETAYQGHLSSIKGRGNATWIRSQKPYSLELLIEGDLLGMGAAKNWVLLANAYDSSFLRNQMAMDISDAIGLAFSPEMEWVDLYLNGDYAGIYQLSERNEIHPQRLDIGENGSVLISMENKDRLKSLGHPSVVTNTEVSFRVHYADMETEVLQQKLQSIENAIMSAEGIDPATGKHWSELIDLDSWAKKYLLEEVMANYDAGANSQYFYFIGSDPSGKLYAGPAWDYDNTLGNYEWQTMNPQAILAGRPRIFSESDSLWYYALSQKEEFSEKVKALYQSVCRPQLYRMLETDLWEYNSYLQRSAECNSLRWSRGNAYEKTEEITEFLTRRMDFLDKIWIEECEYYQVQIFEGYGAWGCFAVFPGEKLTGLPDFDSELYEGWMRADTGVLFDVNQPICEDLVLKLKPR